ncbi:hypothetical protein GW750_07235 [bacterium]|nr:hypothetical protein [bacterium]
MRVSVSFSCNERFLFVEETVRSEPISDPTAIANNNTIIPLKKFRATPNVLGAIRNRHLIGSIKLNQNDIYDNHNIGDVQQTSTVAQKFSANTLGQYIYR